jgi:allantoate deiminase/N-carbamoyl-L-amino-acid hydrolase
MTSPAPHTLARDVRQDYLAAQMTALAELSEPGPGVTRLAYSALERRAHELFATQMRSFGLVVRTDAAGNTIAERPGREPGLGAVGTGSHLDSVPTGGRFDGVAGVAAAMAVAEALHRQAAVTRRAWRFVAFAAEEGARFGQACNGSRMAVGTTSAADLATFTDHQGVTMSQAMVTAGLRPEDVDGERWRADEWFAFVELHVEQGGTLEEDGVEIGIVDVISGSTRLRVSVHGVASHSGATPMHLRRDALVTASACVLACDAIAREAGHEGTRVTVGRLDARPGSITTIPGDVDFTVDIRDVDGARQRATAAELGQRLAAIAARYGTRIEIATIADISPQELSGSVAGVAADSAKALGLSCRTLGSGASHDSQQMNLIVPTGMIFVPSHKGLSHVPEEFTSDEQLTAGARALAETLSRLDDAR